MCEEKMFSEIVEQDKFRDIKIELAEALREMQLQERPKEQSVNISEVVQAREALELTQNSFSNLLGISVRTLQEWEQKRRKPSKSAEVLLKIAIKHPEIIKEFTTNV